MPRVGEKLIWGMYDFSERKRTEYIEIEVIGKAGVHGIEGVEVVAMQFNLLAEERQYLDDALLELLDIFLTVINLIQKDKKTILYSLTALSTLTHDNGEVKEPVSISPGEVSNATLLIFCMCDIIDGGFAIIRCVDDAGDQKQKKIPVTRPAQSLSV